MLAALSAWTRRHATWRNVFLMAFLAAVGAWVDIRIVAPDFAAATAGIPVFDIQPGLRPDEILAQLPHYTAESVRVYWIFFWLDNAFPFVAFLGLALLWAKLLSYLPAGSSAGWRLTALIPFSTLLFDWAENLAFMSLVQAWPKWWPGLASLACALHWGKFVCLAITNAGIVVLALATLGSRLRRRPRPA
jgi:hypothetical protein